MGLGWTVLDATEASREGAELDIIMERIASTLRRVRVFALLNTMKYLRKSGRVSWARAGIGTLLDFKPMIELREGKVSPHGRTRTWNKAMSALAEQLRSLGKLQQLALMHSNCQRCVDDVKERISDVKLDEQIMIVDVTPVIGTHVGPHALGFAAVIEVEGKQDS